MAEDVYFPAYFRDWNAIRSAATSEQIGTLFLACLDLANDDVVGQRREGRAGILHPTCLVGGHGGGIAQVQAPAVVGHVVVLQTYLQASQRQESHTMRPLEEILVDNLVRVFLLPGEDEVSHLLQVSLGLWTVVVVRTSGPEGLLIKLYFLHLRAAIDHGAEV